METNGCPAFAFLFLGGEREREREREVRGRQISGSGTLPMGAWGVGPCAGRRVRVTHPSQFQTPVWGGAAWLRRLRCAPSPCSWTPGTSPWPPPWHCSSPPSACPAPPWGSAPYPRAPPAPPWLLRLLRRAPPCRHRRRLPAPPVCRGGPPWSPVCCRASSPSSSPSRSSPCPPWSSWCCGRKEAHRSVHQSVHKSVHQSVKSVHQLVHQSVKSVPLLVH